MSRRCHPLLRLPLDLIHRRCYCCHCCLRSHQVVAQVVVAQATVEPAEPELAEPEPVEPKPVEPELVVLEQPPRFHLTERCLPA